MSRQMILSAFFYNPQGDHRLSWRHRQAPGAEILGLDYYRRLAEDAERARLDVIFVADHVAVWDSIKSGVAHYANVRLEPLTLLSALAAITSKIGLVVTASSSYSEPYNIARMFASLDHISNGRIAWNVVTSAMDEEAKNFGRDGNIEHAHRYERADEFIEIAKTLWDSWEDDALVIDRESGQFADPAKVHQLNHKGRHFQVRGPLNISRPPQGHPLIFQAGSSDAGRNLAAKHADVQFAIIRNIEEGLRYRSDVNARLARFGRAPESLKLIPGVQPVVAASRSEAEERVEELKSLQLDQVSIDLLSSWTGTDMSAYPPHGPLPALPDESSFNGGHTALNRAKEWARQGLSVLEAGRELANSGSVPVVAGTPADVADQLEAWFVAGAADGYNLMFPQLPDDWTNFTRLVVPELQRRGLFRTEYEEGTLRDRLGLKRPENSFAAHDDIQRSAS